MDGCSKASLKPSNTEKMSLVTGNEMSEYLSCQPRRRPVLIRVHAMTLTTAAGFYAEEQRKNEHTSNPPMAGLPPAAVASPAVARAG